VLVVGASVEVVVATTVVGDVDAGKVVDVVVETTVVEVDDEVVLDVVTPGQCGWFGRGQ
jgi:hypothetical protein